MTESDLSGYISGHSGRIDTLENKLLQINQDILARPDIAAFEAYQGIYNQQIDTFKTTLSKVDGLTKTLTNLYTSLTSDHNSLKALFTGHTGMHAVSGHGPGLQP